ncbi:MAG: dephospho-CoA kinase [Candidatus Eisenbacteria bacterium]
MIVAVTGNTGSGKTEVAERFVRWGGRLIDADRIGRAVWEEDPLVRSEIVRELGADVVGADGEIDRARLGAAVFGDPRKLAAFDRIVQPRLRARMADEILRARREPETTWVLDAALLFEWGLEGQVDLVVAVTAPEEIRAARIAGRHGLSAEESNRRVASQSREGEKARRADRVIVNDGSLRDLDKKARALWDEIEGGTGRRPQGEES